jgi:hypothetical protein
MECGFGGERRYSSPKKRMVPVNDYFTVSVVLLVDRTGMRGCVSGIKALVPTAQLILHHFIYFTHVRGRSALKTVKF